MHSLVYIYILKILVVECPSVPYVKKNFNEKKNLFNENEKSREYIRYILYSSSINKKVEKLFLIQE